MLPEGKGIRVPKMLHQERMAYCSVLYAKVAPARNVASSQAESRDGHKGGKIITLCVFLFGPKKSWRCRQLTMLNGRCMCLALWYGVAKSAKWVRRWCQVENEPLQYLEPRPPDSWAENPVPTIDDWNSEHAGYTRIPCMVPRRRVPCLEGTP